MAGAQIPSLEEACRNGEGQTVEFKRGVSSNENKASSVDDEILKSIVAFANTNDGVIFIGVDDAGHIKGLDLDFTQKDRLEQRICQLIRNRIKPVPPVRITFEDVRGLAIAKIAVTSGEAPAYMIGGTIYVRQGSSDVQAQPEDVVRLVTQYAF
ncbi:MAG: helix-turn-helix domain-containing protein [Bryobacteraceae bacterium]